MLIIQEERKEKVVFTNITITRGDAATLSLPIYEYDANGNKQAHSIASGESYAIQVREAPITGSGTAPAIKINGSVTSTVGQTAVTWNISSSDTELSVGRYYWDAQCTVGGKNYTFYQGWFYIFQEATVTT